MRRYCRPTSSNVLRHLLSTQRSVNVVGRLLLSMCQLFIVVCIVESRQTSTDTGLRCRFPTEWRGRYFQSGLGEIFIRESMISTKGRCIEQNKDLFLLYNREFNCYQCLLLLYQHHNVIQYKEKPSSAIRCPFSGFAYYFAYNDLVHGSCRQALSYAKPCAGNTVYQLQFNHCIDTATFHQKDLMVECLATWKDGSEMYIYGRLNGANMNDREERYRCFKYHRQGNEMSMAMSADATCRGLRSATDGPFLMEFTKDVAGWPESQCLFPDWLSDITWHSFDGQWRFVINNEQTVMTVQESSSATSSRLHSNSKSAVERSEFRCLQEVTSTENEAIVYTMALHNCVSKFQCLKFRKLGRYAVEIYQGEMTDNNLPSRCTSDVYDNVQLVIAEKSRMLTSAPVRCPMSGIHYTTPSDGCIHRINIGCRNQTVIDIDNSCKTTTLAGTAQTETCRREVVPVHQHIVSPATPYGRITRTRGPKMKVTTPSAAIDDVMYEDVDDDSDDLMTSGIGPVLSQHSNQNGRTQSKGFVNRSSNVSAAAAGVGNADDISNRLFTVVPSSHAAMWTRNPGLTSGLQQRHMMPVTPSVVTNSGNNCAVTESILLVTAIVYLPAIVSSLFELLFQHR